ncbi:MAG: 50S ribosomal protein L24 [Candidatus Nitrosocaldus sp.]|nr:50S ribosomal protein L24 [Candidatus Nitrosocaldus sp.]MCS7141098.1 50S ribosomal protein L24 [Candidatus Nitrosocaldus sp.]MDW8000062.1 50S ribosomal protein L24 [Candidatus Nitrosocaldus sp.]
MKASLVRFKQIYGAPLHRRSRQVCAPLSEELRRQYGRRSVRVRKGDTVRVMRGEYKGVEGKVQRVHVKECRVEIEGLQREKVRGDKVPVLVHASKVMVIALDTSDKLREGVLRRGKGGAT